MTPSHEPTDPSPSQHADTSAVREPAPAPDAPSDPRRTFLKTCIGGMTVVSAGTVAYPVVSFMQLPATLSESQIVKVPLADMHEDQAIYRDFNGVPIVMIYTGHVPRVFDASCTHLGCLVAWDGAKHVFHCPCHGAVFNDQGEPVSGPVSRPLTVIEARVEDDHVVVA